MYEKRVLILVVCGLGLGFTGGAISARDLVVGVGLVVMVGVALEFIRYWYAG